MGARLGCTGGVHACAKPASATPATVTAKSDVLVRWRNEVRCAAGNARGAAEKAKMTRNTHSCSVSPKIKRARVELRCCTRCIQRIVTRPISVKVVVTIDAKEAAYSEPRKASA